MKHARSAHGRDEPSGVVAVEHALLTALLAVVTVGVVSADGSSLGSVLSAARDALLALLDV